MSSSECPTAGDNDGSQSCPTKSIGLTSTAVVIHYEEVKLERSLSVKSFSPHVKGRKAFKTLHFFAPCGRKFGNPLTRVDVVII